MTVRRALGALATGGVALAVAAGCNPAPGEGRITLSGHEQAQVSGPTVTCPPPGDGGETLSNYVWEGEIDGLPARVAFAGFFSEVVDTAVVQIGSGSRSYTAMQNSTPQVGSVTQVSVDEDGTLHATASMPVRSVPGATVEVEARLRCPG